MKFPSICNTKVDMNLDVMKAWITNRIFELLGIDDEFVPEYVFSLLEQDQFPDAKVMQINLTGFLENKTHKFMGELWTLLLDAQSSLAGIPSKFICRKEE